ncbi:TagK domain-containing protein [Enterobacter asburiae]|uniref:TagK domain-containing protein n=1 Tax=Enterobacter asburiae TaxID=61645 RepID=UPI0028795B2A|nr:TagK domain-containing protein [Enterobacter asburiae]MDS1916351.1 TagK domain-containing protein [Enterobacter asburiae]
MNIHFEWPASRPPVALPRNLTAETAAVFDVASGSFGIHSAHAGQDAVIFYWHQARPVMLSLCLHHVCLLNGSQVAYGYSQPLNDKSQLQIGHFKLSFISNDNTDVDDQTFYQLIYPGIAWQYADKVLEVEDILPNCGHYINNLRYLNDVILAQDRGDDVLKTLEVEYKRFLIWHEQDGGYSGGIDQHADYIIKTDLQFDDVKEKIKGKTLTECIVDKDFLMEKVWPELECGDTADDIFSDEEKTDLLLALSPEHIAVKGKNTVPELVFQDFYKPGLDSYY